MVNQDIIRVVHIGAGNHAIEKSTEYRKLIRQALRPSTSFEDAITIIETSKYTNTGYGSSLNLLGQVECDASFITIDHQGKRSQGSLSGIDGVASPSLVTTRLYDKISELYKEDRYGLTRPLNLYYKSCPLFLLDANASPMSLVSPESQHIYDINKDRVFEHKGSLQEISDTIGIIEFNEDTTKVITSSGGNFFKLPGRIGCAGIVGCAIDTFTVNNIEVTCMCSGNGEDIVMMSLANYLVTNILNYNEDEDEEEYGSYLVKLIQNHSSRFQLQGVNNNNETIVYVGVILFITNRKSKQHRLIYCHSTQSFYFGFSSNANTLEIVQSRLNNTDKYGKIFTTGEFKL